MAVFEANLPRRLAAEFLGTAFLLAIVIGSGVMGERLAGGNMALALLANAIATGAGLFVLIQVWAPISGAHFNPAVSLVAALEGHIPWRWAAAYLVVQILGALAGVAAAHAMFELPVFSLSRHVREGPSQAWSEFIATFGLVLAIAGTARHGVMAVALTVAAYITAAYWFTASTSFANPAVTLARAFSDTFAGIRLTGVPWFIASQIAGACTASVVGRLIFPRTQGKV